jgi:hypothetical protein
MKPEKELKQTLKKQDLSIYNYTLHYRYRWKISTIVIQTIILFVFFMVAKTYLQASEKDILQSPGYLVTLWVLQGFSFFLYCFVSSLSMRWHIDAFLSPWGGWRTKLPLSISDYQQIEWMFFSLGLAAGMLTAAWWKVPSGFLMLSLHVTLSIPRLFTVLRVQKWKKQQRRYIVKHERQGIGLYSTNG